MADHMEFVIDETAKGQVHHQASCFCHADSFAPAVSSDSLLVRTSKHLLDYLTFKNHASYIRGPTVK